MLPIAGTHVACWIIASWVPIGYQHLSATSQCWCDCQSEIVLDLHLQQAAEAICCPYAGFCAVEHHEDGFCAIEQQKQLHGDVQLWAA